MNAYKYKQGQAGVTLVELMVALVVSSILLLGVAKIYSTSKRSSKVNKDFAVLQEEGRIALNYLVRDIRMAGYMGCAFNNGSTQFQCYLKTTKNYICDGSGSFKNGLLGYDYTGTAANNSTAFTMTVDSTTTPPNQLTAGSSANWSNYDGGATSSGLPSSFPATPAAVEGSDIIVVKFAAGNSYPLQSDTTSTNTLNVSVSDNGIAGTKNCNGATGFCDGDIMLISNCSKATIFQAGNIANATATSTQVLNIIHNNASNPVPGNQATYFTWDASTSTSPGKYKATDSEVMKYFTWAYFVANNANGVPALYRHDGIQGDAAVELVDGVENMQVLYGIDTSGDGTANYYASANQVDFTDTAKPVVAVRISLLVRSKNEIPNRTPASKSYTLANSQIKNASDKRLRKIFTTTIKVRNKGSAL